MGGIDRPELTLPPLSIDNNGGLLVLRRLLRPFAAALAVTATLVAATAVGSDTPPAPEPPPMPAAMTIPMIITETKTVAATRGTTRR